MELPDEMHQGFCRHPAQNHFMRVKQVASSVAEDTPAAEQGRDVLKSGVNIRSIECLSGNATSCEVALLL
jgi:hypothetical protein